MVRTTVPAPRVALVSLGCPKNQVDSELILGRLGAAGWRITADPGDADVLVVNTCAFIDQARAESVDALLDAAAWKAGRQGRRVIAAGCLVQRSADELLAELPELDGCIGLDQIPEAAERSAPARLPSLPTAPRGPATALHRHGDPRVRLGPAYTAYVKIAEGCDQRCSFCAIPLFRGRSRSRPLPDVLAELRQLAREGVVEANLVAQDSTAYGRDLGVPDGLAELVRAADRSEEAPDWIRIHYLHPGRITVGLLEALAQSRRIVEYIDLPFQHAHPAVLRRMNRPGDPEAHLRRLADLTAAMPGAGVRSSFIVGFPGETDEEFRTLCEFVGAAEFDAVGLFTYSHEAGAPAETLDDDVPPELKEERRTILEEVALAAAQARNQQRVGQVLEVLVEGPAEDEPGLTQGRWRGQAPEVDGRVLIEGAAGLSPGQKVRVTVAAAAPTELTAHLATGAHASRGSAP